MTKLHSPWPLFSDDLDFAQTWMRYQLKHFPMTVEAGHTALNIGLRDEIEEYLAYQPKDNGFKQSIGCQFRFRLARLDRARNPYRALIPVCHHTRSVALLRPPPKTKRP